MISVVEFINLHLIIFIHTGYNYLNIVRNNNIYTAFITVFHDKNKIIQSIIFSLKTVVIEDILFRVYLQEFLTYVITNNIIIKLIVSTCFSIAHITNYYIAKQNNIHNIRLTLSQIIFTFLLSYYYLQELSPLQSLLIHQYVNIVATFYNCIFFNY